MILLEVLKRIFRAIKTKFDNIFNTNRTDSSSPFNGNNGNTNECTDLVYEASQSPYSSEVVDDEDNSDSEFIEELNAMLKDDVNSTLVEGNYINPYDPKQIAHKCHVYTAEGISDLIIDDELDLYRVMAYKNHIGYQRIKHPKELNWWKARWYGDSVNAMCEEFSNLVNDERARFLCPRVILSDEDESRYDTYLSKRGKTFSVVFGKPGTKILDQLSKEYHDRLVDASEFENDFEKLRRQNLEYNYETPQNTDSDQYTLWFYDPLDIIKIYNIQYKNHSIMYYLITGDIENFTWNLICSEKRRLRFIRDNKLRLRSFTGTWDEIINARIIFNLGCEYAIFKANNESVNK